MGKQIDITAGNLYFNHLCIINLLVLHKYIQIPYIPTDVSLVKPYIIHWSGKRSIKPAVLVIRFSLWDFAADITEATWRFCKSFREWERCPNSQGHNMLNKPKVQLMMYTNWWRETVYIYICIYIYEYQTQSVICISRHAYITHNDIWNSHGQKWGET